MAETSKIDEVVARAAASDKSELAGTEMGAMLALFAITGRICKTIQYLNSQRGR